MNGPLRGVSLIDVIVGSFLVLVVFVSLFGLLRASLLVSSIAKARAAATTVATSQVEFIRSLAYDEVGTVGGIPAGIIPQNSTIVLDGFSFNVRTYIGYVDDPADGLGASDATGITTDYKRAKVSVTYDLNNQNREVAVVTNIVPPGLETTTGGGTLQVAVVNAAGAPVSGASVRIVNSALSPAVDVTTFSSALGTVYLPGAMPSTEYQVSVTKSGYSTAQTYARDATNQNPTPGYLTVVESVTTTGTFAIDQLASLTLRTFTPIVDALWEDTFDDAGSIASATQTSVSGGALVLSGTPSTYPAAGSAESIAVAPEYLAEWTQVEAVASTPALTTVRVTVLDAAGVPLPEEVLAGNSSGFTTFPVSLTSVPKETYPSLKLRAELGSADPMQTPSVLSWSIAYKEGPVPLPDVAFTLLGTKTVGSTGAGVPLYKTEVSDTTGSEASVTLALEWDVYALTIDSHDVVDACSSPPITLSPGASSDHSLILGERTANAVLVTVRDNAGAIVSEADVTLSRTGYSSTVASTDCGTAYFGALSSGTYSVTITKPGYTTQTFTGVPVSGHTFYAATFD